MRAEYDRRLRMGFDGSSSSGWASSGFGSYGQAGGRRPQPEDAYTFDEFLKDLDKEFSAWGSDRASKGGAPKSLWQELEAIGEVRLCGRASACRCDGYGDGVLRWWRPDPLA